jgi:choline dehydrogenase-like flavoprotein
MRPTNILTHVLRSRAQVDIGAEYLQERDVKIMAWAVEEVRELLGHREEGAPEWKEMFPGEHVVGADLQNVIKGRAVQNSHWVGSCKMGRADRRADRAATSFDDGVVVDEELRVRGTSSLYVADASIFPTPVNGNVHSTVCAVGWKMAEILVGRRLDWS